MNISANLLNACRRNDRKAQNELYKSCFSVLMSVCVRYQKDESEARAALNQGFLKILNHLEHYNPKVPFEAWIRRIMINTLIDEYRKTQKERQRTEYVDFSATDTFNDAVDFNLADQLFDAQAVTALVQQLPPTTQKVFNLYVIDGYSHKEIAEMLGSSEGTTKWHLSTARQTLKNLLQNAMSKTKVTAE
jgi:RNA polymerase sigma factor (sigma-70 family)